MQSPEGRFIAGSSGFAGKAGKKVLGAGKSLAKSPLTVGAGLIGTAVFLGQRFKIT